MRAMESRLGLLVVVMAHDLRCMPHRAAEERLQHRRRDHAPLAKPQTP
jgi:hypothetical protein